MRELLFKCLDDARDLVTCLDEAKKNLVFARDIRYELRTAEGKLNKVIEQFNQIVKEIDAPKNTSPNSTLP